MTEAILIGATSGASVGLALRVLLDETGRKIGGITFYRMGRWSISICKRKG